MRVSKKLMWANVAALLVNGMFLLLAIVHVCSIFVPALLFGGCLAGLILFSARANGLTLR